LNSEEEHMADEGKRTDPGDAFRDSIRAVTGVMGAFKDAIEQTLNELSEKGDISPDRAKSAAQDAMKRAQDAMEDVRGRLEFVPRREFDALRDEVAGLKLQVERHMAQGGHHHHAPPAGGAGAGTGGTGHGAGGSAEGDGSPGL
jgi:polyhydroxyalkanoate synthesis regulator phasin